MTGEVARELDELLGRLAGTLDRRRRNPGTLVYVACRSCGTPVSLASLIQASGIRLPVCPSCLGDDGATR